MRVCPKCGYIDDPLWRNSLKFGINYTKLEDFATIKPHLLERIKKEKFVEELPFVYHLTKGGNVERQAIMENPSYQQRWHIPIESGHGAFTRYSKTMIQIAKRNKVQTRLLEVEKVKSVE